MGIKSADQITIVDVTDAYSVMLTSEASGTVQNITKFQGTSNRPLFTI